jgi:DNA-binding HxlR family transcriptional regulator
MDSVVKLAKSGYIAGMEINARKNCPVARGTDFIGDKWTLLILRNLILDGPHRYQDFTRALEGVSPTTLSNRLKSLQQNGLIRRDIVDGHPPGTLYSLTELGQSTKPIVAALRDFGRALPAQN